MRVADHILDCAVAVGFTNPAGIFVPYGSGFAFYATEGRLSFPHVVTAAHVIDLIPGPEVTVRARHMSGLAAVAAFPKATAVFHPDHHPDQAGHYVDVAVLPLTPWKEDFQLTHVSPEDALTREIIFRENLGVGDEVVTVGMFLTVMGELIHTPIVRVGNIAAMPSEPVPTNVGPMEGHLVETRSIQGLSGSPVFVHMGLRPPIERRGPLPVERRQHYLLGLMHGYYPVKDHSEMALAIAGGDELLNAGIAVVVPAQKIVETLQHPDLVRWRAGELKRHESDAEG